FNGEVIKRFTTEADLFIRKNQLYSLAVGNKYIACGTVLNGLVITDLNGKNCKYINSLNGLQNNTVLSLLFDDENSLWIGLDQGLDRLILGASAMQLNSYGSGYTSFIQNNHIYLGTNRGLYTSVYPFIEKENYASLNLVEGSLGQVWNLDRWHNQLLCSHNRGLFAVTGNHLTPIFTDDGIWQVRELPQNNNYAIAGSYNGFYILERKNNTIRLLHKIRGFEETARNFEIDAKGNIWVISTRGIECLVLDEDLESCSGQLIRSFGEQNDYFSIFKVDEKIYISNSVFCRMVNENGCLEESDDFFNLLDGIGYYSLVQKDERNNFWYLRDNILKVRTYDFRTRTYSILPTLIIDDGPSYFIGGFAHLNILKSEEVIIGCVSGFRLVNPDNDSIASSYQSRSASIKRMVVTNPKDSVVYGESFPIRQALIKIPYKNNSIRFEFGGLLSMNKTEEYSVRLLPTYTDFGEWTRTHTKEYTSLKEGKYIFEIQVRSAHSNEVQTTSIEFIILAPWYRSSLAYWLYVCLFFIVFLSIYKYSTRRIEVARRRLTQQKDDEMRKREYQFAEESYKREKEILKLQNERTEFELKNKSKELASFLLNQLNKNELVVDLKRELKKISSDIQNKELESVNKRIATLQSKLTQSIEQEIEWGDFGENFDLVNDKLLKKLLLKYPWMNKNEQKLCVYIHMGLQTKEIAPLMNLSTRGVEMLRYRMRKKMELERTDDLEQLFQTLQIDESRQ
ncbi:MAG: hypothetical protein ACRC8J_09190, partial [Phocaeicola sp.]